MKSFGRPCFIAILAVLAAQPPSFADEPSQAPAYGRRFNARINQRMPVGPFGQGARQSSPSSADTLLNGGSIITNGESTLLHPKPQSTMQQGGGLRCMPNGGTVNTNPDGSRVLAFPDGSQRTIGANGNVSGMNKNGTSFDRAADGSHTFMTKDGVHGVVNPDGTGPRPNGSTVTRNAVDGSTTLTTKQGYKLQQKPDGTTVFTRTNGIETERTKDGRIRMKQDGQYTNREIK